MGRMPELALARAQARTFDDGATPHESDADKVLTTTEVNANGRDLQTGPIRNEVNDKLANLVGGAVWAKEQNEHNNEHLGNFNPRLATRTRSARIEQIPAKRNEPLQTDAHVVGASPDDTKLGIPEPSAEQTNARVHKQSWQSDILERSRSTRQNTR